VARARKQSSSRSVQQKSSNTSISCPRGTTLGYVASRSQFIAPGWPFASRIRSSGSDREQGNRHDRQTDRDPSIAAQQSESSNTITLQSQHNSKHSLTHPHPKPHTFIISTMDSFSRLIARGADEGSDNSRTITLLIALLVVVFFGLVAFALLVLFRRMRRQKQMRGEMLPQYHDVKRTVNHRGLTIQTGGPNGRSSVIVVGQKGTPMLANPQSPPHSPDNVPEIHITFPDEQDDQGRPMSGRVVVVRVGETSVGLEPLNDEQLPAYEKESKTQFYAIDMDKIGGLKEKEFH